MSNGSGIRLAPSGHRHTFPPQNFRSLISLFFARIAVLTSHRTSPSRTSEAPGRHHSSGFLIVDGRQNDCADANFGVEGAVLSDFPVTYGAKYDRMMFHRNALPPHGGGIPGGMRDRVSPIPLLAFLPLGD